MDAKLQEVLLEFGAEGYGLYWFCLELIAGSVTGKKLTFELEHDARIIARNLNLNVKKVEEMMRHMVNIGLFEESKGRITCLKLASRADDFTRKAITNNVNESPSCATSGEVGQSRTLSDKDLLEDRSKKVEDRSKKIEVKRFASPTIEELNSYFLDKTGSNNHSILINKFFNHYESNGWKVGRNPMKSWKAAANQWLAREGENANNRPNGNPASSGQQKQSAVGRMREATERQLRELDAQESHDPVVAGSIGIVRP